MAGQGPPPEPKPFFWIPLGDAPKRKAPPDHSRFTGWSGRLNLEIEVRSEYLYVGSGDFGLVKEAEREPAYYTFARCNGQLVIPGTSIKGAVRSVLEALSNSCVRQSGRRERLPRGRQDHQACEDERSLCPACRLFGTTGYRGRVHFSDATPVGQVKSKVIKIADLWPPRQTKGRKFYQSKGFPRPADADMKPQKSHRFIEAVPKGARFATTLYFENLSTAEMGLLIHSLGMEPRRKETFGKLTVVFAFPVKIGGAKPRCLGSVYFRPKGTRLWRAEGTDLMAALRQGGVAPKSLLAQLLEWLSDDALLDRKAWETFLKEAKPQQGTCPKEVY